MKQLFLIGVSVGLAAMAATGCDSESSDDGGTEAGAAGKGGAAGNGGSAGTQAGKGNAGSAGVSGTGGSAGVSGAAGSEDAGQGGDTHAGSGGVGGSGECHDVRAVPLNEDDWCFDAWRAPAVVGCSRREICESAGRCARRPSDGKHFMTTSGCLPEGWTGCGDDDYGVLQCRDEGAAGGEGGIGGAAGRG